MAVSEKGQKKRLRLSSYKRRRYYCEVCQLCVRYYIAELVRAEKEHSDWLPEWSDPIRTAKMDRLSYNICLDRSGCFNFDKTKQKCFQLSFINECKYMKHIFEVRMKDQIEERSSQLLRNLSSCEKKA